LTSASSAWLRLLAGQEASGQRIVRNEANAMRTTIGPYLTLDLSFQHVVPGLQDDK
jgi:hypothetical protein